jgi:hypothetical protein
LPTGVGLVGLTQAVLHLGVDEALAILLHRQHERLRASAQQLRQAPGEANRAPLEIDGVRAHRDQLVSAVEEAR